MTTFQYAAFDEAGQHVRGNIQANDEKDARKLLLKQNLAVRHIEVKPPFWKASLSSKKVEAVEILHFSRQLAAFVRSGLSVVDGIGIIARSTNNKYFASVLSEVADQVREGVPLDEALAEHNKVLPSYYLGVIRSASLTGRLDDALEQLASYMERELEAKSKIKASLAYPVIVICMAFASVGLLTVWVMPHFVTLFKDMGTDLPWTTRSLLSFSSAMSTYWYVPLLLIMGLVGFIMWSKRNPTGRAFRDKMLLKTPMVRDIVLYATVERVCRILATLWEAGVPVGDAMKAATKGANNAVFEAGLVEATESVLAGEGLAGPLRDSGMFPDAALQMFTVGEETGTLAEQMNNAADFYSRELDYKLKKLTTMFEPFIIVVVGVFVGFVALALVDAMYGSFQGVKNTIKP